MSLSEAKLKKLQKGHTVQLKHDELADIANRFIFHGDNKKKMMRAYNKGSGIRIKLNPDELDDNMGAGLMSIAKKGAKFARENKQLNKLKDRAIEQGVNYALDKAGADDDVKAVARNLSKKAVNYGLDTAANQGAGFGKIAKKGLKYGKQGLKVGNKISNAMGYDDLDNMAIDFATKQTLGRIDPTLGDIAAKQLNKLADKELERGGGFRTYGRNVNPYIDEDDNRGLKFRPVDNNRQPDFPIGMYTMPNPAIRNEILKTARLKKPLIGAGFRMYE